MHGFYSTNIQTCFISPNLNSLIMNELASKTRCLRNLIYSLPECNINILTECRLEGKEKYEGK